jgi:hypothetical protein
MTLKPEQTHLAANIMQIYLAIPSLAQLYSNNPKNLK